MKLTITEKDQAKASDYFDNQNCLVSTILKRRGYRNVSTAGSYVLIGHRELSIVDGRDICGKFYGKGNLKVLKSAIGKKIELVEV